MTTTAAKAGYFEARFFHKVRLAGSPCCVRCVLWRRPVGPRVSAAVCACGSPGCTSLHTALHPAARGAPLMSLCIVRTIRRSLTIKPQWNLVSLRRPSHTLHACTPHVLVVGSLPAVCQVQATHC